MKYSVYKIRTITNLHVGSGDISFNIVDNQVQRDVLTNFPIINSSSLKGALRDFARDHSIEDEKFIFGSESGSDDKKKGEYKFLSANLLGFPVRSNKRPFYIATTIEIMDSFIEHLDMMDKEEHANALKEEIEKLKNVMLKESGNPLVFGNKEEGKVFIEEFECKVEDRIKLLEIEKLFGKDIAIFKNEDFCSVIEELPMIARNKLENGISQNLWYEEVVPRESLFYFSIIKSEEKNDFEDKMANNMVQIGANASIGYGVCKIEKICE